MDKSNAPAKYDKFDEARLNTMQTIMDHYRNSHLGQGTMGGMVPSFQGTMGGMMPSFQGMMGGMGSGYSSQGMMGMGGMPSPMQGMGFSSQSLNMGGAMVPLAGLGGKHTNPMALPEDPTEKRIKALEGQITQLKDCYNYNEEKRFILTKNQEEVTTHLVKFAEQHGADFGTTDRIMLNDTCPFRITELGKKKKPAIQYISDDDASSGAAPAPKKAKKTAVKTGPSKKQTRKELVEMMGLYQDLDPNSTKLSGKAQNHHFNANGRLTAMALRNLAANKRIFGYIYVSKDPFTLADDRSKEIFADFKEENGLPVNHDWDGTMP